ncbi:hypothetical protein E4631_10455 [Hymenobacter sp. UV11]|uniref:hypothetical protein n=1 Tax=Hymenobacter sp. UV11 TaxID=1849735 RepID=UPI00105FFE0E|nr:hypothetical protein [Hymenobacter sp. UV11]TDN40552.1 hypothetical protein A8B98_14095 [Hymenobacter sp. UV11]TFZ66433.1 hypothetical protein E4631_10455 [Hymenobacter sp. UV11]
MRSWAQNLLVHCYRPSWQLAACWAIAGCSGTHEPVQTAPTLPRASVAPTANVPAMLGKSIDSLRSQLGPAQALPANYTDPLTTISAAPTTDSLAAFRTGGLTIVASYNAQTRRVRDLLVLGRHEDSLLARASLRASAHNYLIMPVFFANKPTHLLGLRIITTK